jgi:hypothetical protein
MARQDFSIYSSGSHFVLQSRTYQRHAQQDMVLITHVKFVCIPTIGLTNKGQTFFF